MHRYLIRILVALLTFAVGVVVSLSTGIFSRPAGTNLPVRYPCSRNRVVVSAPSMTIESQPDEPLKLFYSSTSLDFTNSGKRQVHFLVENVSDRDIQNFSVNYLSSWASKREGGGGGIFVGDNVRGNLLRAGDSKTITIDSDYDQMLQLWVSSAEFLDNSRWDNPRHAH